MREEIREEIREELRRVCRPMLGKIITPELKARARATVLEVLCNRLPGHDPQVAWVPGEDPRIIRFRVDGVDDV